MISLAPFVGKRVVVQLRNRDEWISVHSDNGQPGILAIRKGEQFQFVPCPFFVGTIREGQGNYVIEIVDENKKKLHVALNPDAILSVTMVVEERILA